VTVIDSSGWIEFFTDGPLADDYASRLRKLTTIITPVIVIYEVYQRLKRERSEDDAVIAVSANATIAGGSDRSGARVDGRRLEPRVWACDGRCDRIGHGP